MKKFALLLTLLALLLCACTQQPAPTTQPSAEPPTESSGITVVFTDPALEAGAGKLKDALSGWTSQAVEVASSQGSANNIVISLEDLSAGNGLRPNDYRLEFGKNTVSLFVGSDKGLDKAVKAMQKGVLAEVDDAAFFSGTLDTVLGWDAFYKISYLCMGDAQLYDFVIVADAASESALHLQQMVKELALYEIPIVSGADYTEGTPAFIFTSGNAACVADDQKALQPQQHLVSFRDKQILLLSGDEAQENIPYKMFLTKYMEYVYESGKPTLYRLDFTDAQDMKFTTKFDGTDGFQTTMNLMVKIPQQDNWSVQQGGTSDGVYAYFVMINKSHTPESGKIIKVDMKDWSIVKVSDRLETCHSNDMCYNPDTGKLVVVHNKPYRTKLSIVDPETLTVDEVIDIGKEVYCIGYSSERKQYALGMSGTDSQFYVMDENFQLVKIVRGTPTAYLTQGGYADKDFIYAVRSPLDDKLDNAQFVFDWEGNSLTKVTYDIGTESECMFRIGDLWYTGYNSGGCMVYESIVYKVIE